MRSSSATHLNLCAILYEVEAYDLQFRVTLRGPFLSLLRAAVLYTDE